MFGRLFHIILKRLSESWFLIRRTDWRQVRLVRGGRMFGLEELGVMVAVLMVVGVATGWFWLHRVDTEYTALPDNGAVRLTVLQQTTIGSGFNRNLAIFKGAHLTKKQQGDVDVYSYDSVRPGKQNEIWVEHGKVVFEKVELPDNPNQEGFTAISFFLKQHGYPERNIQGPNSLGPGVVTYVYANKGFAFVGQTLGDTVVEMQVFGKMTADEYLKTYGKGLGKGS